jgi:hypothetical protein
VREILGSVLRAQSKQIAREGLQKYRLRTVEEKMAAGKHSNPTVIPFQAAKRPASTS